MMLDFLPSWPLLTAFLLASLVLAITPGPAVFFIVTRSLTQGRRSGLASVAGVALGNLGNVFGASIGLAALFALSSFAFLVAKYLGAAYLLYLGIQALRKPDADLTEIQVSPTAYHRLFRDGFLVALLNPKTALFFATFLPQFMNPKTAPMPQSLLLGTLFIVVAATTDTCYALAAGTVGPALARKPRVRNADRYITASAFIGLGIFTAFSGSRSAK